MNFKEYADSQKEIIEDLVNKFKNIKKHNFKGQIFCFFLSMFFSIPVSYFINYLDTTEDSIPMVGLLSFLISIFLTMVFAVLFHVTSGKGSPAAAIQFGVIVSALFIAGPGKFTLDKILFSKSS